MEVLKQNRSNPIRVGCQVAIIYAVTHGYLNEVPVKPVKEYEQRLFDKMEAEHENLLARFESGEYSDDDVKELEAALASMRR